MSLRVVIVGGGIGGLSAAVALLAAGLRVEVYEQARQLGEVGAGVGLHQNSQRVLRRLGLREEINRVAARISGFGFAARTAPLCHRRRMARTPRTSACTGQTW